MEKLKGCPLCGSEVKFIMSGREFCPDIVCEVCGIMLPYKQGLEIIQDKYIFNLGRMVSIWNYRGAFIENSKEK